MRGERTRPPLGTLGLGSLLCAAVCASAVLGGCRKRAEPARDRPREPVTRTAYADAARPAIAAHVLFPLHERRGTLEVTAGPLRDRLLPYRLEPTSDIWRLEITGWHSSELMYDEDGALLLLAEEDVESSSRVLYDPPIVLLPAVLTPGEPVTTVARMTVLTMPNQILREEGTCEVRIELVERQRVQTPVGEFDAYVVNEHRRIDLRLAKVTVSIRSVYAPGVGRLESQTDQEMRALGLFATRKREAWRLVE